MSELGVCYVTDRGFLFPTLLSVTSLRRFVPRDRVEVFVVVFRDSVLDLGTVRQATADLGITFIEIERDSLPAFGEVKWGETHVSPAAAGRFLLAALLPPHIGWILYVDGDTLFVRDPSALLAYRPPAGRLAVVEDAIHFFRRDRSSNGRTTRAYVAALGVPADRSYFNSGVILADRETWAGIASEALAFFAANEATCTFHDQSALNAVTRDRKVALSPIWNYQSRFRYWGDAPGLKPRLLHFSGAEKPWLGDVEPWRDVRADIVALSKTLETLDLPLGQLSEERIAAHNRQFHTPLARLRKLLDYRRLAKRRAIARLHRAAAV